MNGLISLTTQAGQAPCFTFLHLAERAEKQHGIRGACPSGGFYYGRIDLKAKSLEDFQNGNFVILEINGANSEATHIYDPNFNLIKAYKEVIKHLNYQHKIATQNHQLGVKWTDWKLLAKELIKRYQA